MTLRFEKEIEDVRGKIFRLTHGETKIIIVETKKGFVRGGHFHKVSNIIYYIISGEVEYREENIKSGKEKISKIKSDKTIVIPPFTAHLLTALEDTIFVAIEQNLQGVTLFPKYREIVDNKMKTNS